LKLEQLMQQILSARILPWLIAAAAAAVLAAVHILEAHGWTPCQLCLEQRIPYWVGASVALTAAIAAVPRFNLMFVSSLLMALAAASFLVGIGLAIQHMGVEQHWWRSTCSGGGTKSIADMLASIGKKPIVACDEKRPFLFGLTLTNYNLIVSAILTVLAASIPVRKIAGRLK